MLQEESKNLGKNTILNNSKPVLTLIPTPIGNLKDITLRSIEALGRAEVVLCEDTRIAKKLYTLLQGRFAEIINSLRMVSSAISLDSNTKTFISFHTHNQNDYLASLSPDFFTKEIIYLSDAGSPSICDPGAALVAYAQTHNLPYEVLPGCCALTTAWAFSGIASQGFVFGDVMRAVYNLKLGSSKRLDEDIPDRIVIFIDELNKYASNDVPKSSPILRQLLDITERGRSLGIILFGAEQFVSDIHKRVKGNCATQAFGRTNAIEITKEDFRFVPQVYKTILTRQKQGEYIIQNPVFRSMLNVNFPLPIYKYYE